MACKSILIVEDDKDIRDQVAQALQVEGYNLLLSENGKQALDLLKSLDKQDLPGCMILDLMMPVMDGFALMDAINRDYPQFASIKILVATAKGSPVNPERVPSAVERIQKPFELDELYLAVEKHCGKP